LRLPESAAVCFVIGHGGVGNDRQGAADTIATGLQERGIASLSYRFLFIETTDTRAGEAPAAHSQVTAAVRAAHELTGLPLIAGGSSYGGRMTSQTQAFSPLPHVRGLAFVGFPLHTVKTPSIDRAEHLTRVEVPILFIQGDGDKRAAPAQMEELIGALGKRATWHAVASADHAFSVRARSGRKANEVMDEVLDTLATWCLLQATKSFECLS
jgi:predicted alpha/beta-hydrolase family hydrolase